ncbi:peroxiredoxin family protein [Flammeovirga kamogawensis]|uniref:Peroxiredoxin family protein n=1 Tax=Flammeovirga kamogawensis TaxID=373891 RepID=A0ABX8GXQ2_9BACT|nr:redoxin domain-containing protein [Flammeovirga kamogawensis]MBB6460622.1 peroxiredoxin [Flammeovirga kamogawensis]QWG07977.1 peroxiredoxin family protein [Flammeovirga kamogawensis]TRX69784.1 peroxiredoxin family protein [Flammeovirga kamogawensis]
MLKDIELLTSEGVVFRFNDIVHKKLQITFLASCNAKLDIEHLKEIKSVYQSILNKHFYPIVIINSSDSLLQKNIKKLKLPFKVLSDPSARIAKKFNCFLRPIGIVQRSTIWFDKEKKQLAKINYMSDISYHINYLHKL